MLYLNLGKMTLHFKTATSIRFARTYKLELKNNTVKLEIQDEASYISIIKLFIAPLNSPFVIFNLYENT